MSKLHLSLFFMLCMWKVGANVNAEGIVVPPSSIFRDDMLFDILWPGDNAKAIGSDSLTEEVYREPSDTTSDSSVGLFAGLTNEILSEVDYSEPEFLDMRTAYDEKYFCEMPHWSASDKQKVRMCHYIFERVWRAQDYMCGSVVTMKCVTYMINRITACCMNHMEFMNTCVKTVYPCRKMCFV